MQHPTNTIRAANSFSIWGRLLRLARTGDFGVLAYRAVRRMLRLGCWDGGTPLVLSGLYSADVADLACKAPGRRSYEVRPAAESDLPSLSAYFGPGRPIDARYRRGDIGLMALRGDEICAAVWFAPGPTGYDEDHRDLGCSLEVPPGVVFSYDGQGTRLGAWGTLMAHTPRLLSELGIRRIVTLIDYENTLSIRSHESLGYRRLGYVGCVKLGRWVQPFCTDGGKTWRMLPGRIGPVSFLRAAEPQPLRCRHTGQEPCSDNSKLVDN